MGQDSLDGVIMLFSYFKYFRAPTGGDSIVLYDYKGRILHDFYDRNIKAILDKSLIFGDKMQILALKAYNFLCFSREELSRID